MGVVRFLGVTVGLLGLVIDPAWAQLPKKDLVPGLNNTAVQYAASNRNAPALGLLNRATTLRPSDTLAYNRALVLIHLKKFEEAAAVLTKHRAFAHAALNLALLQCRTGQPEAGLKAIQQASATGEWANVKQVNIALVQYGLGQYGPAQQTLDAGATGATAQLMRADLALIQGEYAGALNQYNELLSDETYGPIMPVRIGNALLGLHEFDRAEEQFSRYLQGGNRVAFAQARLGLANALYGQGNYDRAAAEYRTAVQLMPYSEVARTGLGNAYASKRDYRNARIHYEAALKQQSATPNAMLGLGVVAFRQGKFEEAAQLFGAISTMLEATNPDHADAFLHQGLMALTQSRYDTARQALQLAAQLRPGDPSAYSGLSEVFRKQEQFGRSLDALQEALAKSPDESDKPQKQTKTGQRHWPSANQNHWPTANQNHWPGDTPPPGRRVKERVPEKQPDVVAAHPISDKIKARMLANQGSLLMKMNLMDQAYPVFREAIKHDPSNLNALNGLAVSLLEMDKLDKANAIYDSLISHGNHRAFLHNNRGIVRAYMAMQYEKRNQPERARQLYEGAKADYERAQKLDTSRRFYQNNLGNILKNLGKYTEAIKSYEGYLSKSAINNLGVLYAASGKPDFSRYYLNLASKLDSSNQIFRYNQVKLYRRSFADSLTANPGLLAAERRVPANSISAKYSRDGFVNIYLYDYDFDAYDYPGDHRFPVQPDIPRAPDLLPVDDFVTMPEPTPKLAPAPVLASAATKPAALATAPARVGVAPVAPASAAPTGPFKRARMPKPANARRSGRWGSTKCPVVR